MDRESVTQALKDSLRNQHCGFIEGVGNVYAVSEETINNVLELLKEKKAIWLEVDEKHDAFDCSQCGAMVKRKCMYCPGCGARMENGARAMSCIERQVSKNDRRNN